MHKSNSALKITLGVIVALFLFYQLYSAFNNPITTEVARYMSVTSGIDVTGIIIRKETVISANAGTSNHFLINDGERVAKDGVIAEVYSSEKDAATVGKLGTLEKQLADIENTLKYNDTTAVDINQMSLRIAEASCEAIRTSKTDKYGKADSSTDEMMLLMNRRAIITDATYDLSAQISELTAEIASLKSGLSAPVSSINASSSGFFVTAVDGYESVLTTDDLSVYTPQYLAGISASPVNKSQCIGKLVSDYEWYIAAEVDRNDGLKYNVGDKVKIKTSLKTDTFLNVTVSRINSSMDSDKSVIVFSCQDMNSELAAMRFDRMKIIEGEYEGIAVPDTAIRVSGTDSGVYVLSGMELKFVKVNIIYIDGTTVICEKIDHASENNLRLFDTVAVKGKNLYDGKIIN